ncbi:hypothetical protein [Gracilibacillus alcaliphilus]|uniref:hypothetical protein n=1 Tax=Gracilibacillus alcaliphilus TaxID=1401441 RepID=UPI00195A4E57|nr:hypothetical protein [Gracilibacillus alcaliphilus]MBM7675489.1 hypothetical protein [Gracilibacillus alcaliphilus]
MGYIIPVDNYQYQQYHQRVTQPKQDPYPIEKLYPSQFDLHYDRILTGDKAMTGYSQRDKHTVQTESPKLTTEKHTEIYAEMTGKGREFEAKV